DLGEVCAVVMHRDFDRCHVLVRATSSARSERAERPSQPGEVGTGTSDDQHGTRGRHDVDDAVESDIAYGIGPGHDVFYPVELGEQCAIAVRQQVHANASSRIDSWSSASRT